MASCRSCGAAVGRRFQFCSQCGKPVGVDLDLLDLAPPSMTEARVQRGRSGRFWAGSIAGVAVVVVGLWALGSVGAGASDSDPAAAPTTTTTDRAVPTEPPSASTSGSATDPTEPTGPADGGGPAVGAGPVLGEPVGLSLLIGGSEALRSLDLDSGLVADLARPGVPLLTTGSWLVLLDPVRQGVVAVPAGDIDAEPITLLASGYVIAAAPGPEPGEAWLLVSSDETGAGWQLLDIDRQATIRAVPASTSLGYVRLDRYDPAVTGAPAGGGVFELTADGYHRVADGELLGTSDTLVLTQTCDQPSRCQLHWLDRATWQPVVRPLPPSDTAPAPAASVGSAYISPGARVLSYYGATTGIEMFDIDRAVLVPFQAVPSSLTASPDGRWVAGPEGDRIHIYDTVTGASHLVPMALGADSRLLFQTTG